MIDIDELEKLAEAAGGQPWSEDGYIVFEDIPGGGDVVGRIDIANALCGEVADFIGTVNPAAVLALISEMRRLREDAERYRWIRQGKPFWVKVPVKDKSVEYFMGAKVEKRFPECLDSSIDAARAKESA